MVLWIFTISTLNMYSKSRNPLLTFLLSYHVSLTSKFQVNFRFDRYWWYCLINFWNFHTIHVLDVMESNADISTELPCLSNLENLGSTSGSRVPRRYWWLYLMDFHNFFTIYVFEVKESIIDIPTELRCPSDLENSSQLPVWEVLVILSYKFLKFSHYSYFWGQGIHCWYFYIATMFRWPRKSRKTCGPARTRGYWWLCLVDFWNFFTIYVFEVRESFDDIPTELPCLWDLKNVMLRHATSCHVMPHHVTSCHVMSRHVTSCHVMSRHATSCHVMSRHARSGHVMSRHVRSCHVMSCHVLHVTARPGHVTSRHVTSCHVMSRHVTSRHVMSKVAGLSHEQRFFVNWLLPHAINSSQA